MSMDDFLLGYLFILPRWQTDESHTRIQNVDLVTSHSGAHRTPLLHEAILVDEETVG